MLIHVVKQGDTIQSIADYYGISVTKLIIDNGLSGPYELVIGQSLIIAYPESTYTVKDGDTLINIANTNNITLNQLIVNNPSLSEREYIYPGETLVISYKTNGKITTHGNTFPYIDNGTLRKTLPYLTYLSILNYTATNEGDIITYYDDTEIIRITKEFGVMPLMLLTTLTIKGEANIRIAYDILLNEDFQQKQIENILMILKLKGYYGVNLAFEYVNTSSIKLYESYFEKISKQLRDAGYLVFVTINTNITNVLSEVRFEKVDYSRFNQIAQNIIFMDYEWATSIKPPSPISSISNINVFLEYISDFVSTDKGIIGLSTIGYDWELPFSPGLSSVYSLTLDRAIDLARNVGARIQFDEVSQTPYFTYTIVSNSIKIPHIVWFIDVRSIDALLDLVNKYELKGIGIWNITIYNTQLWLAISSQYEIEKVLS